MDDNLLDCEGIIIAFEDRKNLISSKEIGEEDFDFVYYDFLQEYECRKILSSTQEPIRFVKKLNEENCSRSIRFQIGVRQIIVVAYDEKWVEVALSHWDINDEIVPSMVGVDIGCGMYTVYLGNIDIDFEKVDEAAHFIPCGRNVCKSS